MEVVKARALTARLSQRKQQIAVTLNHLESQRPEMEKLKDSKEAWARQRRRSLLNYLNRWYVREMNEINRALERVSKDKYGNCAFYEDICQANPSMREENLKLHFYVGPVWNPTNEDDD